MNRVDARRHGDAQILFMDLSKEIVKLSPRGLANFLKRNQVVDGDDLEDFDFETQQALAESCSLSLTREDMIVNELKEIVVEEYWEMLELLLESTDKQLTVEVLSQLQELDESRSFQSIDLMNLMMQTNNASWIVKVPMNFMAGASIALSESIGVKAQTKISVADSIACAVVNNIPFGQHECRISCRVRIPTVTESAKVDKEFNWKFCVLASSSAFDCALAVDNIFDCMYWGWASGGVWTDALEASLLELVVGVSDELETAVRSWQPMLTFIGGAAQETNKMIDVIRKDVELALREHSAYAIGRLHQSLIQLKENGTMLNIPQPFYAAIDAFISAKMEASPPDLLQRAMETLVRFHITLTPFTRPSIV